MKPKEWTALALLFSGIIMAFTALLMPPPGQIHDSVLYIFAQILIYCGSIFGLDSYISRKLRDMNPPNHPQTLMTQESKNRWSVIINIALTTLTALLSALGFTVG